MRQIAIFLAITLLGVYAGRLTALNPLTGPWFPLFAAFALVVGLYGSVLGIDLEAIRRRKRLAILIVTVAVPLQILATGGLMYLIYPAGISFLLGVAIDQIDPLSAGTLLRGKEKMSEEAKGILRVWAAFDDPMTVLFGFLVLLPLVAGQSAGLSSQSYLLGLALNLGPALLLAGLYRFTPVFGCRPVTIAALAVTLAYAFLTQSYLLAAIAGLLLRPLPRYVFERSITVLYHVIVFLVGMALYSYGVDARLGFLLAVIEFFVVQPLTALIMFNGRASDVFRIAYAQQNGLTTLLMGLGFESLGLHVLPILLPAVIAVNIFNLAVNKLYSWKEARGLIS